MSQPGETQEDADEADDEEEEEEKPVLGSQVRNAKSNINVVSCAPELCIQAASM